MDLSDLSDLFVNPLTAATVAALLAYLLATGLRQWMDVQPVPIALVIAVLFFLARRLLSASDQAFIIDLLSALLATLAAMGVSLGVEKLGIWRVRTAKNYRDMGLPAWRSW